MRKRIKALVIVLLLCALGAALVLDSARNVQLTQYTVASAGLPESFAGFKIVQLSDFHGAEFVDDIVTLVKAEKPDIIALTGDFITDGGDLPAVRELAQRLTDICDVYFVSGNHEHQSGEWEILEEALVEAGVTVLNNGKSVIERNGDTITLLGLADKKANRHYDLLLHSLMAGQEDSFNILLSHRPELFETYVHEGLDLVFTGHAHGGQIVIPFFRQGIFAPHQGFFPKYTEGMHEKDGTVMIVSRGLGNSSFPFRIFNRPELIEVTLRQEGK